MRIATHELLAWQRAAAQRWLRAWARSGEGFPGFQARALFGPAGAVHATAARHLALGWAAAGCRPLPGLMRVLFDAVTFRPATEAEAASAERAIVIPVVAAGLAYDPPFDLYGTAGGGWRGEATLVDLIAMTAERCATANGTALIGVPALNGDGFTAPVAPLFDHARAWLTHWAEETAAAVRLGPGHRDWPGPDLAGVLILDSAGAKARIGARLQDLRAAGADAAVTVVGSDAFAATVAALARKTPPKPATLTVRRARLVPAQREVANAA